MKEKKYEGKLSLELAHVGKLSKFKLIRQVNNITHDFKKTMQVVKEIDEINETTKAFYELFEDSTREYLIKLDKEINKYYNEFCKATPFRLVNRSILADKKTDEQPSETYRFIRKDNKFKPIDEPAKSTKKWSEELGQLVKYEVEIVRLAELLHMQEKAIECAIEVALKDAESKKVAIEMASYLGYINGNQYEKLLEEAKTHTIKRSI